MLRQNNEYFQDPISISDLLAKTFSAVSQISPTLINFENTNIIKNKTYSTSPVTTRKNIILVIP